MIKKLKNWLELLAVLYMLACLPIFSGWLKNRFEVSVFDLFLPLALRLCTSLVFSLIFYKVYAKNRFAGLVTGVLTFLIIDGTIKFIKPFDLPHLAPALSRLIFIIVVLGIMLTVGWLISKLIAPQKFIVSVLAKGIFIAVFVAFILQFVPVIKVIIVEWPQFFYRPAKFSFGELTLKKDKPDIYYLVFDRYTNESVLKEQFNFDNSELINFLTRKGFFVDPNAYSNYPYTTMSISSTLLADYHHDLVAKFSKAPFQTQIPYHNTIAYASVIKTLKKLGYSYYHLGSWYEATNHAPLADYNFQKEGVITIFGHSFVLNNFSKNVLLGGIYGQIIKRGLKVGNFTIWGVTDIDKRQATLYKLEKLNKLADEKPGGRFIFAHILCPHDPYYFNPDGSYADFYDKTLSDGQKYLNQIQFINNQIKNLVLKIQKNSNRQAIIIIQSDEGPYPMFINSHPAPAEEIQEGDMQKWPLDDLKMKYGILAAYYIPQATKKDLKLGADSVNIFRLIFNAYFDARLPYLPRCYYGYPFGRNKCFIYADITKRLLGDKINPACSL